ncbi:MAG: hypothetical protein DMC60_13075 [Verrucomicrobia bacterium]|nr:MAG: hypothetical protein DMC60_13075 [Verrucomicrobiota bacterium]
MDERIIDAEVVEERIVTCPQCHRRNRLYKRNDTGVYKCGACHAAVPNPFVASKSGLSMRNIGIAAASVIALLVIIAAIARNSSSLSPSVAPVSEGTFPPAAVPQADVGTFVPENNLILFDAYPDSRFRGQLTVNNGTSSQAVAKLVDIQADRKILSFVISARQIATIYGIPDGTYQLLFAFGDQLYVGTDRFHSPHGFSKFVRQLTLDTRVTDDSVYWSQLSVTLHPVISGNAKTSSISQKEFERY